MEQRQHVKNQWLRLFIKARKPTNLYQINENKITLTHVVNTENKSQRENLKVSHRKIREEAGTRPKIFYEATL